MKALLDTNVLIDYFAKREPFWKDAFKLRIMQEFGDVELWASIQSFSDISYILRNACSYSSLQDAFLASLNFLRVCSLDQKDLGAACEEKWPDLEDCLVEQCSRKLKADFILTRDLEGFSKSAATVLSPTDFFSLFAEQYGITYDAFGY
jgi:predicted nucleic acid-binding protein